MGDSSVNVCVVGLGYIGLPTASLLACSGYQVHGVDVDELAVANINQGKIRIDEPDLDSFVWSAVNRGTLTASTQPVLADIFILCVPTPFHGSEVASEPPRPNIDYVLAAATSIAPYVLPGNMVILESTSPVGTTHVVAKILLECGVDIESISVAYCPERVLPGKIMTELVQNDRIVGGINAESTVRIKAFYETFIKGAVYGTDCKTAEMAKLVENSYRDVNIAFANELSMICAESGIDVWNLIDLANRHPRVKILQPGAGVGGHCIAVDPWFIVDQSVALARLIRTAREVNDSKPTWVAKQIQNEAAKFEASYGRTPVVACLGLTFKPDIGDLRESPSWSIVEELLEKGFDIRAVEPNVAAHPQIRLTPLLEAVAEADIVAVLVRHKQFRELNLSSKVVLDYCGLTRA